jgi:hypothetical protein
MGLEDVSLASASLKIGGYPRRWAMTLERRIPRCHEATSLFQVSEAERLILDCVIQLGAEGIGLVAGDVSLPLAGHRVHRLYRLPREQAMPTSSLDVEAVLLDGNDAASPAPTSSRMPHPPARLAHALGFLGDLGIEVRLASRDGICAVVDTALFRSRRDVEGPAIQDSRLMLPERAQA